MMEIYLDELDESYSEEFNHHFQFIDHIASGAFGTVVKANYLIHNKEVAVKIIDRKRKELNNINKLKQEISILKQLKHKNIVEFYGFIETNKNIYIIMEYIKGGTLKSLIEKRKDNKFSEEEASQIIKNLLSAVDYLHSRNISHRDIKPENIMIDDSKDFNSLKLVDFGLSAQYYEILEEFDFCGTLIYMAPEQIEKKTYTKTIDMWSVGIIMFMLLNNGLHPLYKAGEKSQVYKEKLKNKNQKICFKGSQMAKSLLDKLLDFNPINRYSADRALTHPWITRRIYDNIPITHFEMWNIRGLKAKFMQLFASIVFLNNYKKKFMKNKITQDKIQLDCNSVLNFNTIILKEYIKLIEHQSRLKKDLFMKERNRCLDIIINESDNQEITKRNSLKDLNQIKRRDSNRTNKLAEYSLLRPTELISKNLKNAIKLNLVNEASLIKVSRNKYNDVKLSDEKSNNLFKPALYIKNNKSFDKHSAQFKLDLIKNKDNLYQGTTDKTFIYNYNTKSRRFKFNSEFKLEENKNDKEYGNRKDCSIKHHDYFNRVIPKNLITNRRLGDFGEKNLAMTYNKISQSNLIYSPIAQNINLSACSQLKNYDYEVKALKNKLLKHSIDNTVNVIKESKSTATFPNYSKKEFFKCDPMILPDILLEKKRKEKPISIVIKKNNMNKNIIIN